MSFNVTRRSFLAGLAGVGVGTAVGADALGTSTKPAAVRRSLFDGKSLEGWRPAPRLAVPNEPRFADIPAAELKDAVVKWYEQRPDKQAIVRSAGKWAVIDGAIVGGHQPPESQAGAYLLSEQKFADFELELEARPDWPADTGIMIRAHELGSVGFQVLVDHRPKGCIGGCYGNGIGGFLVAPYAMTGDKEPGFRVANLHDVPPENQFQAVKPTYGVTFAEFIKAWRPNDWNAFRIRCVGRLPVITTWINGTKICELDTATIQAKGYEAEAVAKRLGRAGHIGFEVHDVNLKNPLGQDRWGIGAVCRWRNIFVTEL